MLSDMTYADCYFPVVQGLDLRHFMNYAACALGCLTELLHICAANTMFGMADNPDHNVVLTVEHYHTNSVAHVCHRVWL